MNKTALKAVAISLVALLSLSACGVPIKEAAAPMSTDSQSSQSGAAQSGQAQSQDLELTLNDEQVLRITEEIQDVIDASEEENDPKLLDERLTAQALQMRTDQFTQAKKTKTDMRPLVIDPKIHSATVGDAWPRVLLVATETDGEEPTELFFITQRDAQDNYKLENWTRLVGGTSVKGVSIKNGSRVIEADAPGLTHTPEKAVETYVKYLNKPKNKDYQIFDDDVFSPRFREEIKDLNKAIEVAGRVKAEARTNDNPVIGVALSTGDALVSASFNYKVVYERTVPRSSLELAGTPAAYLDNKDVLGTVTVDYLVTIFFLVPPEDSDNKISVVGSERVISSVKKDDEKTPDGE